MQLEQQSMLTKFRDVYEKTSISFGRASLKMHLTPDAWTVFSLVTALIAAVLIMDGRFILGALMVLVMNLGDMMDGATARAGGIGTKFGTVFDHVSDRYAEFFLMGGLMAGGWVSPVLGLFAASGIVMASYVRAKAESAGNVRNCVVGIAGRQEKLILLYAALLAFGLHSPFLGQGFVFLIGLISHITAYQRLMYTREQILGTH
jgi:phosphatidylglycerophosphate synthase